MTNMTVEEVAAAYLEAEAEAKAASKLAKELKDQLASQLTDGDRIVVNGVDHAWSVREGSSPKYGDLVNWLTEHLSPDAVVMIEEARPMFTGVRITKSLKPVG